MQAVWGEEYSDFLKEAFRYFMGVKEFRRQSQHALVIHDRSKAHTAKAVTRTLSQMRVEGGAASTTVARHAASRLRHLLDQQGEAGPGSGGQVRLEPKSNDPQEPHQVVTS